MGIVLIYTYFIFSFVVIVIVLIYYWLQRKYNYWKTKNVPNPRPTPFLGNYADYILMKKSMGTVVNELCQTFQEESCIGAYFGTEPALIIKDPEHIKLVLTKYFYYYNSREIMKHAHKEPLGSILFSTYGDRWKVLRQNMTPMFSSGKMKSMFPLIEKCALAFEHMLDYETGKSDVIDVKNIVARYTLDCIGSCSFGIEIKSMDKDSENNPFRKIGENIFKISNKRGFTLVFRSVWPRIFYALKYRLFPKTISTFFHELLTEVFKGRDNQPSSRNDFIDLILRWKESTHITGDSLNYPQTYSHKVELKVDDELLEGAAMQIFSGGFETSATVLSFTLFELAKNQEAQSKAIEEVDSYLRKNERKLDYNCVTELPYLEACIDEAMRMYPILSVITREVVQDHTLPSGLHLERGLRIHLPIHYLHHHPDYFPEPEMYRPERFLPGEIRNITPYTYLPFGEGPRICIGLRFSRMQTIPGLLTVLKKYRMDLADGMPQNLDMDPRGLVTHSRQAIRLKLVPRDGWQRRLYNRNPVNAEVE